MKRCLFVFLILAFASAAFAAEPMPRKDFIAITAKAVAALDAVDAVFSRADSTRGNARIALKKLDSAIKKYDPYEPAIWPKGPQEAILKNLLEAYLSYGVYLQSLKTTGLSDKEMIPKAVDAGKRARQLFSDYKGGK